MKNLWYDLENLKPDIMNPIDLVTEQSKYLSDGTNGIFYIAYKKIDVLGTLTKALLDKENISDRFKYKLNLSSEFLPEYEFNMMGIYYDIMFYPLIVNVPRDIGEEISSDNEFTFIQDTSARMFFKAEHQEDFESILRAVFNSSVVRTAMKNMRAIIGDIEEE